MKIEISLGESFCKIFLRTEFEKIYAWLKKMKSHDFEVLTFKNLLLPVNTFGGIWILPF